MSKAVNLDECQNKKHGVCRCEKCAVCGFGKHTAIHGPYWRGGELVNEPWGHEYVPEGLRYQIKPGSSYRGLNNDWTLTPGMMSIGFYELAREVWVQFEGGVSFPIDEIGDIAEVVAG